MTQEHVAPGEILQGYYWSPATHNYVRAATGRFVARQHILDLLERSVAERERRLVQGVQTVADGRISPATFFARVSVMLKRQYLQNAALARGGWDRLTDGDIGRIEAALRVELGRARNLAAELADGRASVAQGQNRITMYLGNARRLYFEIERETLPPPAEGMVWLERRRLTPADHCTDCVRYAALGWQPVGVLPVPSQDSQCDGNCRCILDRRQVGAERAAGMIGGR